MKRPTLEEVYSHFKDAEIILSCYGREFKNNNNFREGLRQQDYSYYAEDGTHEIWNPCKGYAKILTYKNNDMKITKEFIKANADKTLKEVFPEVCVQSLEKMNWLTKDYDSPWIVYVDSQNNIYGIDTEGNWFNSSRPESTIQAMLKNPKNREATNEEVFEALKNEAVRRGYKEGAYCECLTSKRDNHFDGGIFLYDKGYNTLHFMGATIFDSGKWATIIETITKAEAEHQLNKKII